jgi:hypothetical protein
MIHLAARLTLIAAFGAGLAGFVYALDALSPWGWALLVLYVLRRLVRRRPVRLTAGGSSRWADVDADLRPTGMVVRER